MQVYNTRAPKIEQAKEILKRVKKIAQGAALMTETKSASYIKDGLCDFIPNRVITTILSEAMQEVGPIPLDDADRALAHTFHETLSETEYRNAFGQIGLLGGAEMAQKYEGQNLFDGILLYHPWGDAMPLSTDVGDVS